MDSSRELKMSNQKYLKLILGIGLILMVLMSANAMAEDLIAGDANGDGNVNISDAVWIINYVFIGGDPPADMHSSDVNNDCRVNVSDAVGIVNYIFNISQDPLVIGCTHHESTGECVWLKDAEPAGTVYIDVLGNDLHILHLHAFYQCCLGYLIEYSFEGGTITAQEADSGELCDCYCHFDKLESFYYDLADGEYTVIVIGIEGDTLAVQDIVVDAGYGLYDYTSTGCIEYEKSYDPPDINYSYLNGILHMSHTNAYFNCGGFMVVQFEQAADTLRFIEVNISDLFAYCMCYFSVTAEVVGIAPGTYVAEVYGQEPEGAPNVLTDRRTIVLGE
jgi:hypothetical protein